jgi:hypothetical protein
MLLCASLIVLLPAFKKMDGLTLFEMFLRIFDECYLGTVLNPWICMFIVLTVNVPSCILNFVVT